MQRWPDILWVVRHGESAGNVARDAADAAGHSEIDIDIRDVDVQPSSIRGKRAPWGRWVAGLPRRHLTKIPMSFDLALSTGRPDG